MAFAKNACLAVLSSLAGHRHLLCSLVSFRDSDNVFLTRRVCMVSHGSNNTIGSSLIGSTLAEKLLCFLCVYYKLLTQQCCMHVWHM